jgi:hypothetical protein
MATLMIKRYSSSSGNKPECSMSLTVGNGEARNLAKELSRTIPVDGKQHTFEVWEADKLVLRTSTR